MLSVPWVIVQHHAGGSSINATLITVVSFISLFWGLYVGTLIDRYNRKHIFLIQNAIGAVVLGGCSLGFTAATTAHNKLAVLCLAFATTSFIFNVHYPNLYAFLQELFPKGEYARVSSLIEIQGQITNAVGMTMGTLLINGFSLGGFTVEPWHQSSLLALNAGTYVFAWVCISFIRYVPRPRPLESGGMFSRVATGFAFLRRHTALLVFGIASYCVFFSTMVTYPVIFPSYIKYNLHGSGVLMGLSEAIFALGALGAGWFGLRFARRVTLGHPPRKVVWLTAGTAWCLICLVACEHWLLFLALSLFLGLFNALTRIVRVTYILNNTPNHLIGRVNSFFQVVNVSMRIVFSGFTALAFAAQPVPAAQNRLSLGVVIVVLMVAVVSLSVVFKAWPQPHTTPVLRRLLRPRPIGK